MTYSPDQVSELADALVGEDSMGIHINLLRFAKRYEDYIAELQAKLTLSEKHNADLRAQNATLMSDLNASRQRDKARF